MSIVNWTVHHLILSFTLQCYVLPLIKGSVADLKCITPETVSEVCQERIIKKRREEERVTLVVAVVTAESPACTINRASCYMPAHMAISKCEILIGRTCKANIEMLWLLSIFYF